MAWILAQTDPWAADDSVARVVDAVELIAADAEFLRMAGVVLVMMGAVCFGATLWQIVNTRRYTRRIFKGGE